MRLLLVPIHDSAGIAAYHVLAISGQLTLENQSIDNNQEIKNDI